MLAQLNMELEQQGLPKVTETIYHWRMGQALSPQIRQSNRSKELDSAQSAAQEGEAPASSLVPASSEAACVVLPPIRTQPDLARHLERTSDTSEARSTEASNTES